MKTQTLVLIIGLLIVTAQAKTGKPEDIPEAGRIRIDGNLQDWKQINWTPLNETLDGNPANISNAQWALRWDEDGTLYIAVRYDDADIALQDNWVNSGTQDCVEIFVRGDTGSKPVDYSEHQKSAQQYVFGLARNKATTWKKLASAKMFPAHNPATAAVKLDGKTFTYEMMVPLYDNFSALSRRNCERSEVFQDSEIGIDIAIVDAGSTGYAGRKAENTMPDKAFNASHIAEHTLGE
ncbi:MAG: hypothetical protein IT583_03000 [Verrucomicrobia bacterium]|nr:hypothetical protein [Verrucomicrobiota bacterium]